MRKLNAVVTALIMVCLLFHIVFGSYQLIGIFPGGKILMKCVAWIMTFLILVHTVIGCVMTVRTLRIQKKTGASYFKENKMFWARRISGFAIILFLILHIVIFLGKNTDGSYRLNYFGSIQLLSQICLVLTIALHVISNVKPMLITFGIKSFKDFAADIIIVLSFVFVLAFIAFLIYFVKWQSV